MKKSSKRIKKSLHRIVCTISIIAATIVTGMINASAAAPSGVSTTTTNQVIDIVVWIAIVAVGAGGGIPSVIKISEGQANEDTRGRNSGIAGLAVTAAVVGSIYAIKTIFFS